MKLTFTRKTAIIGLVVVVIVLGLVLYTKKNQSQSNNTAVEDSILETENTQENSDTSNSSEDNNQEDVVITASPDFSATMQKAQKAYGSKDYAGALAYYNQAATYSNKSDLPYSGMFGVYSAQGEWLKAQTVLDTAISLNALNTDYWKWKLTVLDEKTATSFADLKKIYQEGMIKSTPKARINLVIHFARIAETNNEKAEAMALWQKAIELNPTMKTIYQAEIDALKK